jgi:transposase/DNA-binding CsgD family transcriptional regulator
MVYVAAPLVLREGDRERLGSLMRSSSAPAGLVKRARIVLLAADGVSNTEIAAMVGVSRPTVISWRSRYEQSGLAGLEDQARSGRPAEVDEIDVVVATLSDGGRPPAELGVTHWSSRLLAAKLGTSFATVARIWRKWDIQPHRVETFKFSTDPRLEAKIRDVVGLYLDPPHNAVVVSVDEKSQIQALDRTQPILPVMPGVPERQTHDYKRNGTTTLFAALEVKTGKVSADACYQRHTNAEFLKFLKLVAKAHPRVKLHVIVDNYSTHKHANVKAWLARNPRVTLHFTPTSCSWLNMVEIFFGIITRQAIRRGTFYSVKDLKDAIRRFIDAYNDRCEPFTWTKTADELLAKIKRQETSSTRH